MIIRHILSGICCMKVLAAIWLNLVNSDHSGNKYLPFIVSSLYLMYNISISILCMFRLTFYDE